MNDKNYCKDNCKRATREEQNSNTRRTKAIMIDNKRITSTYISKLCGIKTDAAKDRILRYSQWFMTIDELFRKWSSRNTKIKYPKTIMVDWICYDAPMIMRECWIKWATARRRLIRYYLWEIDKDLLFHKWAIDSKFKLELQK